MKHCLILATLALPLAAQQPAAALAGIDRAITGLVQQYRLPGAVFALCRDNRLVFERAYGLARREPAEPMTSQARFRLASIAKPLTAIAVMQLVERGQLRLEDKVYEILRPQPYGKREMDPRWQQVTIRQLLQHTGGWDRGKSFDPMFRSKLVAAEAGIPGPAGAAEVIRYMAGRPLDFEPGSRYAYSNFGYSLLGRVIERKTGLAYAEYMRQRVFAPLGMDSMAIGRSLLADRLPGEVFYHSPKRPQARSVFPEQEAAMVPWPYGGFFLESMDSHGAWIGSARDLLRLARDLARPQQSRLLAAASIQQMFAPPPGAVGHDAAGKVKARYYACGWVLRAGAEGRSFDHGGSLPGTSTRLVCNESGTHWVLLLNSRQDGLGRRLNSRRIEQTIRKAIAAVTDWPEVDLLATPIQRPPQRGK